jgi:DNA-directed RNA polymerase specialized sigma24 family protein
MSEEMTERGQWIAGHILPWESQVRGWFRRIVPRGLEVDDVIQEAYAIFSSLADVSRIGNPRTYFHQVVRSLISEHFRRAGVETRGASLDVKSVAEPQEGLTPERILSGRQDLDRLYPCAVRVCDRRLSRLLPVGSHATTINRPRTLGLRFSYRFSELK